MPKSTKTLPINKPSKPYEGFPLFPHASGRWAKKIRGRFHYFGSWREDPEGAEALKRFNQAWPYLKDGLTPPCADAAEGCTLRVLCNAFLNAKQDALDAGDLSPRTFKNYRESCDALIGHFGRDRRVDDLRPDDFASLRQKLAKRLGPAAMKTAINRARVVFKFAADSRLVDRPVHFGQAFNCPSARSLRKNRNEAGLRLFEANELRRILDAADVPLKAMALLGINCGFGNSDVANLPQSAIDFEAGIVEFPRPKTEIPRRVPLWPETTHALREAMQNRPEAKDKANAELFFLTRFGKPWVRVQPHKSKGEHVVVTDALSQKFSRLLRKLGINGRRGLGFYTLRHCFETIGGECRDQVAVNAIMGHVDSSMAAVYRERISDKRLRAVTDTVREWLWPEGGAE